MNEQTIILFFLIVGTGITLFLYLWKAKKEIEYKKRRTLAADPEQSE